MASIDHGGGVNSFVELDTIAQISVTLAAFTGLLAGVRGGNLHEWAPRSRLGFWLLLSYCLSALGFSVLPTVLRDFGVDSWGGAIALLAAFHVICAAFFLNRHIALSRAGDSSRSQALWYIGASLMSVTPAILVQSRSADPRTSPSKSATPASRTASGRSGTWRTMWQPRRDDSATGSRGGRAAPRRGARLERRDFR